MGVSRSHHENNSSMASQQTASRLLGRKSTPKLKIEKREVAVNDDLGGEGSDGDSLENLEAYSGKFLQSGQSLAQDMEDLTSFLTHHREEEVHAKVEHYKTTKPLLKGNVFFFNVTVTLGEKTYSCTRKYEEFVTLGETLRERLKGAFVPPLNKRGIGNESDSVLNRTKGLEAFLISVLRHPFLKADTAFHYFLTSTEKFKPKYLEHLKVKENESSKGFQMWRKLVQHCKTAPEPLAKLTALSNECVSLRNLYRTLSRGVQKHVERIEAYAADTKSFGNIFQSWKEKEASDLQMLSGVVSLAEGPSKNVPISNMVYDVENSYDTESLNLKNKAKELSNIVIGPLSFELMVIDSLKEDIKNARRSVMKFRKADSKWKELQTSEKRKQDVDAAKIVRDLALEEAHFVIRAALVVEVHRFRLERARRAAEILEKISALNLKSVKSMKCWESALNSIPQGIKACSDILIMEAIKDGQDAYAARVESDTVNQMSPVPETSPRRGIDDRDGTLGDPVVEKQVTVRVLKDYEGEHEQALTIKEGSVLTGLLSIKTPEWIWIIDPSGNKEGYAPSSHVEVIADLASNQQSHEEEEEEEPSHMSQA